MAAAWAAASVTTCPPAVRVVSGGCPAEIGTVRPMAWSFRSLGTCRESPGQLPRPCGCWPGEAMQG